MSPKIQLQIGVKYRPDIDGLRAVAVMLVILFHTGLAVPGGFIGVDVFFVISGYLITGIVLKEQQGQKFTLKNFWSRRIKRILPASLFMSFAVLIGSFFLLSVGDYKDVARASISQQLLSANIYFWRNTGYFDGASELKPLLHTWSLAVEEQFYLFYPFLLVLIARFSPRAKGLMFACAIAGSFILSVYGTKTHPEAAFYLLPTRAWELLTGGIIWFLPTQLFGNRVVRQLASLLGFTCILSSAQLLGGDSRFPGINAVPTCVGTALVIMANSKGATVIGTALSGRVAVYVGLISYSLYLWHWPILAFVRYWLGHELSVPVSLACISCTIGVAHLSWKYVEAPFRGVGKGLYKSQILLLLGLASPLLLATAISVLGFAGFPNRASMFPPLRYQNARDSKGRTDDVTVLDVNQGTFPVFGNLRSKRTCVVWGDSHAAAIIPAVSSACDQTGIKGNQLTRNSTAPIVNFVSLKSGDSKHEASQFNRAVVDYVATNKIDFLIMTAIWSRYERLGGFSERLEETLAELSRSKTRIAIMLDVATHDRSPPMALAYANIFGGSPDSVGKSNEEYRSENADCNAVIERLSAKYGITVLRPAPLLVDDSGLWKAEIGEVIVYRDVNHLTVDGALLLEPMFLNFLRATSLSK